MTSAVPKRSASWPLFAAILLALAVRLPIIAREEGLFTRYSRIGDMRGYHLIATNLVEHGRFSYGEHSTAWRPPLYPLFLAGIYAIDPGNFRLARIAQALIFITLVPTVYALSRRMVGGRGAAWAAIIVAVYPIFVHYSTELLSESLAIVGVPLVYLLFLRFDERPTPLRGALLGVTLAATLMVRPQILPGFGVMILLCFREWADPGRARARVQAAAIAVAMVAIVFTPWIARNARVFHAFIPFSTNSGYVLYNTFAAYRSQDWDSHVAVMRSDLGFQNSDIERADTRFGPDEPAFDRQARARALAEIRAHPREFLATLFYNFQVTLLGIHREDFGALRLGRLPMELLMGTIPYWIVVAAAIAGIAGGVGVDARALWAVLAVALLGTASGLPIAAGLRYRVPILDPVLIVLAGAGIDRWIRRFWPRPGPR